MATAVGSLWSREIRPHVQSPFAILELQGRALAEQTEGVLVGDVRVMYDEDRKNTHVSLDIVVPALDNYRHQILTATHNTEIVYPVQVDAECFRPRTLSEMVAEMASHPNLGNPRKRENDAVTDTEFRKVVERVLQSPEVTSLAVSLIARAEDVLKTRQAGQADSERSPVPLPP